MHLLLGIKNILLDHVLLRVLPYGSRIIFAGPHKVFTQGDYKGVNPFCQGIFDAMEEWKEEKTQV